MWTDFPNDTLVSFLRNENDRARAQKRGGGHQLISLDEQDAERRYLCEPATETDPAKTFEQRWAATLLNTVLTRVQEEFGATGRADLFEALQAHLRGDSESIPYAQLAGQFGLSLANVKTTPIVCGSVTESCCVRKSPTPLHYPARSMMRSGI